LPFSGIDGDARDILSEYSRRAFFLQLSLLISTNPIKNPYFRGLQGRANTPTFAASKLQVFYRFKIRKSNEDV
jgi:hypothetical protein